MRVARILLPVLVVLAAAGFLRRSSPYYAVDAATGQPVQMVQGYDPAAYQPAPAPQSYAQADSRALYGSPQAAQEQYGAPVAPEGYAPPSERSSGRGLFNSRRRSAQAQYAQPAPQQSYVVQYQRQQQQQPSQQSYAAQIQAPQSAGGPYMAAQDAYASATYNYPQA
jgi:hypothetical protein